MTPLRQRMIEDMELRNLAPNTQKTYLWAVSRFATFFGKSPEQLGREEIRTFLLHLVRVRKLSRGTYSITLAALRFLYRTTLGQEAVVEGIQYPKTEKKLPVILSLDEMERFFDAVVSLKHRAILMTAYAGGLRVPTTAAMIEDEPT